MAKKDSRVLLLHYQALGEDYYEGHEYRKAITYFNRVLRQNKTPELLTMMGNCFRKLAEKKIIRKKALKKFEYEHRKEPENQGEREELLKDYSDGLYKDAIRYYELAIELKPNYGKGWYGKAMCYYEMEKYEDAEEFFREAYRRDQKCTEAKGKLTDCEIKIKKSAEDDLMKKKLARKN
jgi:tetratricopeptide (TPR) repeat protein